MAVILKAVPFGPSGRERQNRIEPIQGLDSAFLVHAENSGIGGRLAGRPYVLDRALQFSLVV